MAHLQNTKTLSVSIACPPDRVYAFASNPENMPRWAIAFVHSVKKSGEEWFVETPIGSLRIRFVESNAFGVLDHYVRLTTGVEILNPMRVVPNGTGSEVLFTLFQSPEMSEQQFAEDADMVARDLRTLKNVLEQ